MYVLPTRRGYGTCGNTGHYLVRFDGPGNDGACADACPGGDMTLGKNDGADADQRPFAYLDVAAQVGARRHMYVVGDQVMVIHTAGSVQNDVTADAAAGVDDGAGTQDRTG